MSVFDGPKDLERDVNYSSVTPWKNSAKNSNERNDELNAGFGSYGVESISPDVWFKLNIFQLFGAPLSVFGVICAFGGLGVLCTCCSVRGKHVIHPAIANSMGLTILTGLAIIVLAVFIVLWGVAIMAKREELFKREVVQKRLECDYESSEYLYQNICGRKGYEAWLLRQFNIRRNAWNEASYNDYMVGKYHSSPFVFFDCCLIKHIPYSRERRRQQNDFLYFRGQILVFKMKQSVEFGCQFYIDHNGLNIEPYHSDIYEFDDLLNGKTTLEKAKKNKENVMNIENEREVDIQDKQKTNNDLDDILNILSGDNKEAISAFLESHKDVRLDEIKEESLSHEEKLIYQKLKKADAARQRIVQRESKNEKGSKIHTGKEAMQEARQYLMPMLSMFNEAVDNARCGVGWIMMDSYLVIILENGFNPFEFGYGDLFRSSKTITGRVDKQAKWIKSILEPHVRAGLI